jgi:membrane associated rhomboid family serine protease
VFLPIGDTPNPVRFRPWVNYGLIAANVLVYLLIALPRSLAPVDAADPLLAAYLEHLRTRLPPGVTLEAIRQSLSAYDLYVFEHGYKPGAPALDDLFSSMFLHGGFAHLAGNMLFLWIYGDNVEHRLGRAPYLLVYLGTGVVGTLSFGLLDAGSMTPLVGASGAISGALGLYFVYFPRNQVKLLVALFPFFFDVILLPARWVLGFYIVVQNLLPMLIGAESSVAYGAHFGGFVAGALLAWAHERRGVTMARPRPTRTGAVPLRAVRSERPAPIEASGATLMRAVSDDDPELALSLLRRADRRTVLELPPAVAARLAEWLYAAGEAIGAEALLRACLSQTRRWPPTELARAALALGLLRLAQGQPTAAYQHLLAVLDLDPEPETAARARAALAGIDVYRRRT